MTAAQRRRHYNDWLTSGMTRTHYARLHGIHIKTFGNLCRDIAAEAAAETDAPDSPSPLRCPWGRTSRRSAFAGPA
jgi:hypothetical protein